MNAATTATQSADRPSYAVSSLQGDAWAAWNASYHAEDRDAYRAVSLALYGQDVHERIERLFARSDEQNRYLDMILTRREDKKP